MNWKELFIRRAIFWKKLYMERDKNKKELHITYKEKLYKQIAKYWTSKQIIFKTNT